MRILVCFYLVLLGIKIPAQSQIPEKEKGSIQVEVGLFGDFRYTGLSAPQMEGLSGEDLPLWAPALEPNLSDGSYSSVNAGYYSFAYQKPLKPGGVIWWSAGISFLFRNIAECSYSTDTTRSISGTQPGIDSIYIRDSWLGNTVISGSQFNFPLGLRFVNIEMQKRWVQVGLNLAPGFTFSHEYRESTTVVTSTAVAAPSGPEHSEFRLVEMDPARSSQETKKLKGSFFTAYAGLPVNFCFNPTNAWQFLLTFEPGYTITMLGNETVKGAIMGRMGIGVKYSIKNS